MKKKIGACFLGALGSISITAIIGALAIKRSLADSIGMITSTDLFDGVDLISMDQLEFFGFDVREQKLRHVIEETLDQCRYIDPEIIKPLESDLKEIEHFIYPGINFNCGQAINALSSISDQSEIPVRKIANSIESGLRHFKESRGLDDLIVINLASTEPILELQPCHDDLSLLEHAIDSNLCGAFRASSIYAYAAIRSKCPYINFTPSNGALFPAMLELAHEHGVPVMGNDGKTGETLVKSALAPMFKSRNLQVLSWEGFNILGNLDGKVLDHPDNRESKIRTKDALLPKILGYSPHSSIQINYVPSLDDQKTAWDFIHFKGFLGTKMSLQFIWQGLDSMLAAPLALDLVRLAEFAHRRGESGLMPHLASYFKAPLGVEEHGFSEQFALLASYVSDYRATHNSVGAPS